MERKKKIIIATVIAVVLVILGVLLYLWLMRRTPLTTPPITNDPAAPQAGLDVQTGLPSQPSPVLPIEGQMEPSTPPAAALTGTALTRLASAFAERYGSYANVGDFENLLDLKPIMTAALAASTDAYVASARAGSPPTSFLGVTSRAVNAEALVLDEGVGVATVSVDLLREERLADNTKAQPYYQRLVLSFVKTDGEWKVSRATWEQQKRPR